MTRSTKVRMPEQINYQFLVRGSTVITFVLAALLAFLPDSVITESALVEKAQFAFGVLTTVFAGLLKLPEQYRFTLLDRVLNPEHRDHVFTALACVALVVASLSYFLPAWITSVGGDPTAFSTAFGGASAMAALMIGNTSPDEV